MDCINQKIVDLELPFMMDTKTKGRGNCFFHGIVQQIERNELQLTYYGGYDHNKLRADVCTFAINQENDSVAMMALNYDSIHGEGSWITFFRKMSKPNVFIEGPVAQVMAIMLDRSMCIISQGNNESNPYMTLNAESCEFPPLILANIGNVHYQSYLPVVYENVTLPVESTFISGTSTPVKASNPKELKMTPLATPIIKTTTTGRFKRRIHPTPLRTDNLMPFAEINQLIKRVKCDIETLHKECRKLHAKLQSAQIKEKYRNDEEINGEEENIDDEYVINSFNTEMDPEI